MYKIKTTEWELNEEEREGAQFILETSKEANRLRAKGTPLPQGEKAAFDHFLSVFYAKVAHRVKVRLASPVFSAESDFASMCVSDDGKKVVGYRVEKV